MFRVLTVHEAESAYEMYLAAFNWLQEHHIRQWLAPTRRDTYLSYAANDQLLGLFNSEELVAAGRVFNGFEPDWKDVIGEQRCWWLSSLAVCRSSRYPEKGRSFLRATFSFLEERAINALHLDCVNNDDFLPRYYQSCGFERLYEKPISYKSGNTYPMVLMKASVPNHMLQGTVASGASLGSRP